MTWQARHIQLVEAVNAAMTEAAHRSAEDRLTGFREAISEVLGIHPGRLGMLADEHYITQGIERPMCCGVFLDWEARR